MLLLGTVLIDSVFFVLNGWVLFVLWRYFSVPIFGLPALNIFEAIGVGLVVSFLTGSTVPNDPNQNQSEYYVRLILIKITRPVTFLFFGWIVSWFM